jgi:hypothetical protein
MKYRLSLALFVVVLAVGWYLWGPAADNLTSLKQGSLSTFTGQFDAASNDERVLLLVSPT